MRLMSLQEFYVEGGQRATLSELKHTGKMIEGAAPSYDLIRIYTAQKPLGVGSTGTVYHAKLLNSHSPKFFRNVVVKFPNTLLDNGHIKIEPNGKVSITQAQTNKDKRLFHEAIEDLEIEFHNGFLLREGAEMMATGIADPAGVKIRESELKWQVTHPPGYFNIHNLLDMDPTVPCLISAFFETALLLWARDANPSPLMISSHVVPQIRAGLHYMHHVGHLAHMDIKPYNMLCSHTEHGLHVVLCDFGATTSINTAGQNPAGTVGYMAPEVEQRGVKSADYQEGYSPLYADAYSYAVSVLHLLHPHVPCETVDDQPKMLGRILKLSRPGQLTEIVNEKKPARRYALFTAQHYL